MIELSRKKSKSLVKLRGFHDYEQRLGDEMRGRRASLGKSILDVRRELGIKPCTIRAIEECDDQSFESPAFIAGNVRRYAMYLGFDPDEAYSCFREECGLDEIRPVHPGTGQNHSGSSRADVSFQSIPTNLTSPGFSPKRRSNLLSRIDGGLSFTGVGSTFILLMLIAGISYLAWSVYQEFQRLPSVQVAGRPQVEPISSIVAIEQGDRGEISLVGEDQTGVYAPLGVNSGEPLLTIGEIEPGSIGATLINPPRREERTKSLGASLLASVRLEGNDVSQADELPLTVIAIRPSWVRVTMEDGTVLLEKILAAGEEYVVPDVDSPLMLRSGNSGFVYFVVGQQVFGPAGSGTGTVRNIDLSEDSIRVAFVEVSRDKLPTEVMNVIQLTESQH